MKRPLPSPAEVARILAVKRSRPPRTAPPTAGRALSPQLRALETRFGKGPRALQARWREILGDDRLARFTEPVKLVKLRGDAGVVLELKVEGPAAALVQHQAEEILQRVNLALGPGTATRLRVIQGKVSPAAAAASPPRARARPLNVPLDAAREAELLEPFAAAPDGPLKAALIRLGRGVLRDAGRPSTRAPAPRGRSG